MKNLSLSLLALFLITNNPVYSQTITGPNSVDIGVPSQFTANFSLTNATINSYTWTVRWIGPQGSLNGQSSSTATVNSSSTSNTATIIWDRFFAPINDYITCSISYNLNGDPYVWSSDMYVHLKGIPDNLFIYGLNAVQECCTNEKDYEIINYGDGDIFNWSYPVGWSPISGIGTPRLKLLPDYHSNGDVKCEVQISTTPSFYSKSNSIFVSRPLPVINHITSVGIPCVGTQVTFFTDDPCGTNRFDWVLPSDWVLLSQENNSISVIAGSSGIVSVSVTFDGGCVVNYSPWVSVISVPPNDPSFDNECHPSVDLNGCPPGPKRICALNGGIIDVVFDREVSQYNCSVSSPWLLREGTLTGSQITVMAANINDVEIFLPSPNSTNSNIHYGTYKVQAVNCQGNSQFALYDFHRELDWWCDCPQFNQCVCPPKWVDSRDKCNSHPVKISDIQNVDTQTYPNPNNGTFSLNMPDGNKNIEIYDVIGNIVFRKITNLNNLEIELLDVTSGLYFVRINTGSAILNEKLIIQK